MLLTCPTCRSGLEVPDGTTAHVRCPACQAVFSAAEGRAASEPDDEDEDEPRRPAKSSRRSRDDDDDDDRPRSRRRSRDDDDEDEEEDEQKEEARKPRRKRRDEFDEKMSPEEKAALRAAFDRGAWGCKLLTASLGLYMLSMICIIGFWFQFAFTDPDMAYLVAAGALGALGWALGAVGVGLCLSAPTGPGHWVFGIAAAVATGLHALLLLILAMQGKEYSAGMAVEGDSSAVKWALVPTRLDAVTMALPYALYTDLEVVPTGKMVLSIIVGIAELVRTTLILTFLGCLARAAGDDELSHRCTRAAGFASIGPGLIAVGIFVYVVVISETRASGDFVQIISTTLVMGTYAILAGCVFPGFMAARDVADACDEPFTSRISVV